MSDPLLNGPQAFTLLAIILALSAYLRSISEARSALIDNIEYGVDPFVRWFPPGADHTNEKLAYLRSSKWILVRVAHVVIGITLAIASRIFMVSVVRLWYPCDPQHFSPVLRWFDFILLGVLVLLIAGLWYVHARARRHDKCVRKNMERWRIREGAEKKIEPQL